MTPEQSLQARLAFIRLVRAFVAAHPDVSLEIIRSWLRDVGKK